MRMKPTADNLRELMRAMYPDVDDGTEHPMTAVGIVLLAAGIFGITDEDALVRFTSYPKAFIVALIVNLRENGIWENSSYDYSGWLSDSGAIDGETLWGHVEAACGLLLLHDLDVPTLDPALDPCQIYWNNKEFS